ncbi:MAG: nuclear transport factor 2 family protein [Bacteroidia bacterium]|nr:nuclear transport factor 2 family protein [Bacteroidia bacterium]
MKLTRFAFLILPLFLGNIAFGQGIKKLSNIQIVERFFEGMNDPSKIQASLDLLTDDYAFKNPLVELKSKPEFIALVGEIGKVVTGVKLKHIAENDQDEVVVLYEFTSSLPGMESNFATEWFWIKDGKIVASHMIYDTTEWRKVYAQMER